MAELTVPRIDFTPLSQLGQVYQRAQSRQSLSELGRGLADGSIDFKQAAGRAADMGDIDTSLKFLALDEQRRKQDQELAASNQFTQSLSRLYGGQPTQVATSNQSVGAPNVSPPSADVRAPVASTPKVWGDEEAVKAGIYDAPTAKLAPQVVQAQGGGGFQSITASQIPVLLQAVSNPRLPVAQKELAGKLLTRALDETKTPDKIRVLQQLKADSGFQGSLLDLEERLKAAGKTEVNINQTGEKEYEKQSAKEFAEMNRKLIEGAQSARMKVSVLTRMGDLLNDPNLYTGAGGEKVLSAKRLAKAVGVDVGDLSSGEAMRAIGNQFALELRNPAGGAGMPGALSDKDREFLQASVPGLEQSREGNAKIIDYMKRVAQRSVDVERLRQDYVKRNGRLNEGFYRELEAYSNANPLFPEADRQPASATPPMQGARQAPDGNWYVQQNGKFYRVDQ